MREDCMRETNMGTTILENNKTIKYIFVIFIFLIILQSKTIHSFENKIVFKINNEIITSVDIENEINYLTSLNPALKQLDNFQLIQIAKNSLIREKIKQIEISKYNNPKLPEDYLKQLIKNVYKKIEIKTLDDFKKFLEIKKINFKDVQIKIETEALWNEIIISKYSKQIKVDKESLRKKIKKNIESKSKLYLMSEILFEVNNENDLKSKYSEIVKSIKKIGFESTATKFSISESSSFGGKLDWINENSLNNNIRKILNDTKINKLTEPISIPGGFLILKVNNIKFESNEKNIDNELKKLINSTTNNQLNQFSIIYYNKVKENIEINEI